jgi:hypothetical protein
MARLCTCVRSLSRISNKSVAISRHWSKVRLTILIRSDDFQVDRSVESRIGERLDLLSIGVDIYNVRILKANSVVHQYTYRIRSRV